MLILLVILSIKVQELVYLTALRPVPLGEVMEDEGANLTGGITLPWLTIPFTNQVRWGVEEELGQQALLAGEEVFVVIVCSLQYLIDF